MEEVFRRKPYLQFLRGKSADGLSLTEARDGSRIPAENGKPLCSAYGPAKEADRILSGATGLKRTQILVILGAGNPELFRASAHLHPGQICAVVDHRLGLGAFYLDQALSEWSRGGYPEQAAEPGDSHGATGSPESQEASNRSEPLSSHPQAIVEEKQAILEETIEERASSDKASLSSESRHPWTEDSKVAGGKSDSLENGNLPPLRQYLNTPGCHVFFGEETLISLEHYLEGLPAENFQGIRFLRHRASVDKAPAFYEYVETRMRGILQSRMSDLLTRFEFEPLWLRNTLLNSHFAKPESHPSNLLFWSNRWPGKPALLVSAGPSLTETLPWIKENQDRFFILACDTALKPLLRAGIRPHGAHILDAQKQTLLHFLNEDLSDLILFADLVCHPSLPRHLKPAGWVFSSTARLIYRPDGSTEELKTPGTDLLESMCGAQGLLQSGGSVATSAFDLLRFLGFRRIYFAGQDLAWTFRQLHALNTHHYERWNSMVSRVLSLETINERVMQKRDLVPVSGIDGREIPGDFILSLYRSWFEQSIESLKSEDPVECINLSRTGSLIEGMRYPRLENPEASANAALHSSDSVESASFSFRARQDLLQAFEQIAAKGSASSKADFPSQDPAFGESQNAGMLERIQSALLTLYKQPGDQETAEKTWAQYPELRALIRKTEVYISRNREKLSDERADGVYRTNLKRSLNQFLRFSSRYI